ncbi:MAG TPA: TonB-dependent receptor [Bryobacteraceae bacterium]|nr:TonB-dependent receptor [Bryobacteraceae bacterium]
MSCIIGAHARAWRILPALAAFALLLFHFNSFAQERFGELNGTITDPSGAVLPNVAVSVTANESGRIFTTKSGSEGTYVIRPLEPGYYTARFELTGFTTHEVPSIQLLAGQILKVNAPLQLTGSQQSVQVTESAPLIDVTQTIIAHDVTSEEIERLPKGRSFQQLALVAPSVNSGEIEGGFQVNGASGAENQFIIDGVSTTSLLNGKSRQDAAFEILKEVQVKTGGITAEYGGAMGGVISAITRSGGNQFHGDVHYYYGGNRMSAGPVKRLLLDPTDEKTVSYVQDHKNQNDNHEPGFSLGGPFIRNKLYFFSAASPRWQRTENTYLLDDGTDTVKRERTFHMLFNKLNWDPTSRVRTNFTWLWTPTRSAGRLPAYDFTGNRLTLDQAALQPYKSQGFFQPQSSYTGQVDVTLTSTTLLTVRGGRFWDDFNSTGIPEQAAVEWGASSENIASLPPELRRPTGYRNIPRALKTYHDVTARTHVQTDAGKYFTLFGQHNLKGGWGLSKTVNNVDERYPGAATCWSISTRATKAPSMRHHSGVRTDSIR